MTLKARLLSVKSFRGRPPILLQFPIKLSMSSSAVDLRPATIHFYTLFFVVVNYSLTSFKWIKLIICCSLTIFENGVQQLYSSVWYSLHLRRLLYHLKGKFQSFTLWPSHMSPSSDLSNQIRILSTLKTSSALFLPLLRWLKYFSFRYKWFSY